MELIVVFIIYCILNLPHYHKKKIDLQGKKKVHTV